ncbi:porin family protein [Shewanella sp. AS1]|nr:porin family protein [Shewanella sp. AS1]
MALVYFPGAEAKSQPDWFIAPYVGSSFAATEMNATDSGSSTETKVKVADTMNVGLILGVKTRDPGDIYLLYSHQASELRRGDFFSPAKLTDLDLDYLHVGGSLYFPKGDLRPYVTASIGLTQMRPEGNYASETRFSMGFGLGAEYLLSDNFALFADARGYATFLSSGKTLFCNANQCAWYIESDIMWQGQVNAGIKFSF